MPTISKRDIVISLWNVETKSPREQGTFLKTTYLVNRASRGLKPQSSCSRFFHQSCSCFCDPTSQPKWGWFLAPSARLQVIRAEERKQQSLDISFNSSLSALDYVRRLAALSLSWVRWLPHDDGPQDDELWAKVNPFPPLSCFLPGYLFFPQQ